MKQYVVDAFTDKVFAGNPAAVCVMDAWLPDETMQKIAAVPEGMGMLITAPSGQYDFVSRTFFPKIKVNEDPVCGSAHCNFIPYWSQRLGKNIMTGHQVSPRGGIVYCENKGERVLISGKAALYSEAEIFI